MLRLLWTSQGVSHRLGSRAWVWVVVAATVCFAFSSLCQAEESHLLAYWSFDESDQRVAHDMSGNDFHLLLQSARRGSGISGQALVLKGSDSVMLAEAFDEFFVLSDDYAVEAWVKHDQKTPQIYLSKWTGTGMGSAWWMGFFEGCVQWAEYNDQFQVRLKGPDIADGRWHQVVGVRSGKQLSLFVDGELITQRVTPGSPAGHNAAPLKIGGFGAGRRSSWPLVGSIDEVRIYCRALSAQEINERFKLISSGQQGPVLQPIANGLPARTIIRLDVPSLIEAGKSRSFSLVLVSNRPFSQDTLTARFSIKDNGGRLLKEWQLPISPKAGSRVSNHPVELPALPEGTYDLEAAIGSQGASGKIQVKNLEPTVAYNLRIKNERAKKSAFYRGIVSAYSGMRYKPDGTPDVEAMLGHLSHLGVNVYTYLIAPRSSQELAALGEFCQKARSAGIEVWVYLVPPSEAPIDRDKPIRERRYPPFDMDYVRWAEAVAQVSLDHPNLTLWMIDDFDGNLGFFTREYTQQIYKTSKQINPRLLFGVCVYHESLANFVKAGYLDYVDALLWGYQHSSARYPECGLDATTLPLEIHDYLQTGKIAIPCIYFTPHSSWTEGRPTKAYLEEAMKTAFEQAGIVWVFTTPRPGTMQEEVVRAFTQRHPLPKWPGQ
ncbi:MAG: LamG domain-containing protein [Thermogutta sp.]|nr:LamG domain-containing protein [Thermogutta sp.]HPZ81838.1 LamG domain-containing protein [Thermogutta sp.]HQF12400.1 LamG domain-containing protein [Thermogutta sp.]